MSDGDAGALKRKSYEQATFGVTSWEGRFSREQDLREESRQGDRNEKGTC